MITLLLDLKALFYSLFTLPSVFSLLFSHSLRITRHRGMYINLQCINLQVDYSKNVPKAVDHGFPLIHDIQVKCL